MFGVVGNTIGRLAMTKVGFSPLGTITGRTPDQLKNMGRLPTPPWEDDEFQEGKRRQYDASHALRLILMETLTEQGASMSGAAEAVSYQASAIARFLAAVEAHEPLPALFVGHLRYKSEDRTGARWTSRSMGLTTAEEISEAVAGVLSAMGTTTTGRIPERIVAGPSLAVASIGEGYRLLKERAAAAGYAVDGRSILRVVADAD